MVIDDYWRNRASASPLRKLLIEETALLDYLSLGEFRPFRDALGCQCCLLHLEKRRLPLNAQDFALSKYQGSASMGGFRQGRGRLYLSPSSIELLFQDQLDLLEQIESRAERGLEE